MKKQLPLLFTILILLLWVPSATAHKVNLFAYTEGNKVYTEGYFSDGHPAEGEIKVFDNTDTLLLKGKNNREGMFDFINPNPTTPLRIVLNASMGHRCTFTLKPPTQQ